MANFITLEKPLRGSNFGEWDIPVNANMTAIEIGMFNLYTNNKNKTQSQILADPDAAGASFYDTAAERLGFRAGDHIAYLVSDDDMPLKAPQQNELQSGSVTSLHSHNGSSDIAFKVQSPNDILNQDDPDKQYYAVPFKLFNDTLIAQTAADLVQTNNISALTSKLNGISANGTDLTVDEVSATGRIDSLAYLKTRLAQNSNATIQIGGQPSSYDILLQTNDTNLPLNISSQVGTLTLQVQGEKVWTAGNDGTGSGCDADKVDGRDVDDTITTTNNLWTADKTSKYVIENVPDSVEKLHQLDISHFVYTDAVGIVQNINILEKLWPIGSIYMNSVNGANPSTLIGFGSWARFGQGRMLVGESGPITDERGLDFRTFQIGEGGGNDPALFKGEYSHKLIEAELPSHSHSSLGISTPLNVPGTGPYFVPLPISNIPTGLTGGNATHNNMPPYIVVYMWTRIA